MQHSIAHAEQSHGGKSQCSGYVPGAREMERYRAVHIGRVNTLYRFPFHHIDRLWGGGRNIPEIKDRRQPVLKPEGTVQPLGHTIGRQYPAPDTIESKREDGSYQQEGPLPVQDLSSDEKEKNETSRSGRNRDARLPDQ